MNLKDKLNGYKKIKVEGMKFIIKKLNPFLDFPSDKMPQIFTSFISGRKVDLNRKLLPAEIDKFKKDMYSIIEAGVVKPELVSIGKGELKGKEEGITVEDLFRDLSMGYKLYFEILAYSLNRFSGLKGLFFSMKIKHVLFTEWRKNTGELQQI